MTLAAKRRRLRRAPVILQPAELGELCDPGTNGRLRLAADLETGRLEHSGDYVYVGSVRGLHAFAPAGPSPVLFLHRTEVVSFRPRGGPS